MNSSTDYELSLQINDDSEKVSCPQLIHNVRNLSYKVYPIRNAECPIHYYTEQRHLNTSCDKLLILVQGISTIEDGDIIRACLITKEGNVPPTLIQLQLNYTIRKHTCTCTHHDMSNKWLASYYIS